MGEPLPLAEAAGGWNAPFPVRVAVGGPVTTGSVSADSLLVAIAEQRDRAAFAALFRAFAPRVKHFLVSRGAAPEIADELVQEVMLLVWRRADRFDASRGAARTWIFTIARNALVDRVRATRRPEVDLQDPAQVAEATSGESEYLAKESHAALALAIDRLPDEQVDVLRGAYFRGRSLSELATGQRGPAWGP